MASKQKRVEEAKKRDKRSKIALVGLAVVMVAVGAYEIPSMLKVMNKKAPAGSTYDPGPSSVVGGLPDVAGGSTTSTAPTTGQLVDTDIPPVSGAGQLVTFEVFQTKNPFVPQVASAPTPVDGSGTPAVPTGTDPTSTTPTSATPTATTPAAATPTTTTPGSVVPGGNGTATTPASTTAAAPTVTIAVNGVPSRVGVSGTFPEGTPVFRLVSYKTGSAQIGIVGGSYAAGGSALTLQVGHPVTLQNTTDGRQYKLELLKTPA
jgi:hypothetical protein